MIHHARLGNYLAKKSRGIVPGTTPDRTFELYSVPAFEHRQPEIVTGSAIGSNKQIVEPGTVLLCKINPRINRAWTVGSFSGHQKIASTEWITFPPHPDIEPKFLTHFLSQTKIRDFLAASASGVGGSLMRVKPATVEDLPFPLPDIKDQRRIVAEFERQFSRLDEAVANLKRVKANLRHYERAIVTTMTDATSFVQHRVGTISDFAISLDYMRRPVNKIERARRAGPIPYLGANGRTGWIDEPLFDEELVLVVEDETFVGRQAPFSYYYAGKCWVNNHTHVLRTRNALVLPKYLNLALSYYPFTPLTTGSTGRRKLTKLALMSASLIIPSIAEQHRIVAEVERRLSLVRKIETEVGTNLKRADVLRSATLTRFFSSQGEK